MAEIGTKPSYETCVPHRSSQVESHAPAPASTLLRVPLVAVAMAHVAELLAPAGDPAEGVSLGSDQSGPAVRI